MPLVSEKGGKRRRVQVRTSARPGAVSSVGELCRPRLELRVREEQELARDSGDSMHGAACGARGLSRHRRESRLVAVGGRASQPRRCRHRARAAVSA
ncbi:MAG: hypothetical protein JHC84_22055 [Solirubrobacteraceae bacterium]|nr:hypothetical protein [Solirubrobacteraceae bacterium]